MPVHRDEIIEFQPVQSFYIGRNRFRIVHRGLDQIIEIKLTNIQGPAHMGAPVAHDLGDLGRIAHRIELRFYRVRPRCYLTER